jgi:hypothetical protein
VPGDFQDLSSEHTYSKLMLNYSRKAARMLPEIHFVNTIHNSWKISLERINDDTFQLP